VAAPRTGAVAACLVDRGLRGAAAVELLAGNAMVNRNPIWRKVGSMARIRFMGRLLTDGYTGRTPTGFTAVLATCDGANFASVEVGAVGWHAELNES